jgi:hypothetical protein
MTSFSRCVATDRSALDAQKSAGGVPRDGTLKIISFNLRRQRDVIERILRHCGLWEGPLPTLARAPAQRATWNWCLIRSFCKPSLAVQDAR